MNKTQTNNSCHNGHITSFTQMKQHPWSEVKKEFLGLGEK